jgi:hypothetical protein
MTPLITSFAFISIIASLLLLLAGVQAIASFNAKKRIKRSRSVIPVPNVTGAKIIPLPRNAFKPSKETMVVNEVVSEEIV